ncbi:MAG: hypothetical protein P8J61_08985 [Gammaproteobacteria bacterium]|jgi:hypothetical protein|nr:hypothetical protein [Gammaproteobacteria bacterium]
MDETTRQEYLNSMGIQSYFPRYVLPAAKESDQCVWPESFKKEQDLKVEFKNTSINKPLPVSIKPQKTSEATQPTVTETSDKKEGESEEVRFKLAMIHVNDDVLVLILLPYIHTSSSLSAIQKQLFINIFNSLYSEGVNLNLEIQPFSWPFSEAMHIEKDGNAAKASLAAYLEQLKGKFLFKRFILMGEKIAPFVDAGNNYELTVCRSLDEMLKMPQLKREVWHQLKKSI